MKHYDPDKELHEIRAMHSREYYRLGHEKYLQKINDEGQKLAKECGLDKRSCKLPIVKFKHIHAA